MFEFIFIVIAIYILAYVLEFDLNKFLKNHTKQNFNNNQDTVLKTIKSPTRHHPNSSYKLTPTKKRNPLSYAEKLKKGKEYESVIAKLFSCRGYTVTENGRTKGRKDGGIDLIASKVNETVLMQCKNWKSTSKYKIRHNELKKLRSEGRDFLEEHKEYVSSNMKLLFVLAEDCVHPSAKHYLEDIKNKGKKIDIEIIPISAAEKEIKSTLDIITKTRKVCPRCNQGFLVPRTLKNKKYENTYKNKDFLGCSRYPKCRYSENQ